MISCVYCEGEHASPADVRACWQRQSEGSESAPAGSAATELNRQPERRPERPIERPSSQRPAAAPREPGSRAAQPKRQQVTPPDRRGPAILGRNAIVRRADETPEGWQDADRVVLDKRALADPEAIVKRLQRAAHASESLVFEIDPELEAILAASRPPESIERAPVHELSADFTLWADELHHLVFSNSFDARDGSQPATGTPERWVDHGPIRYVEPIDGVPVVHAITEVVGGAPPLGNDTNADLAADQLAAVTHTGGSARIMAPAGSGKTRVLTERARHLLTQWRLPASSLCLVAFNKRAQVEMSERTSDLPNLQVRTLNSIALAIINGRAPFAPQRQNWRTIDEPDVRRILHDLVKSPRRLNVDPIASYIDALSSVRLGLRSPDEVEPDYGGEVSGLRAVYNGFVERLERAASVDFDHQIVKAIEVLLTQPEARRAAQRACRVLLVDEFQDLTPAHLLLVRLLAGPVGSVFGVGDDDQTIYGYNGADPGWLIEFAERFPGAGDHPLEVNYRCPTGIVEVADRLLRHNQWRVGKTIRARAGAAPGGWSSEVTADPVAATVSAVEAALDAGAKPADIAVLTRVNTTIAPVQVALNIMGIAISGGVGTDYAERTAVRAAFAWLRLAESDVLSDTDVLEALRRPSRKLHPRVRDWVAEQRDIAGIRRLADRLNKQQDTDNVNAFADDLERLQGMNRRRVPTSDILNDLVENVGLGTAVSTLDDGRRGTNRSAQSDDLHAFRHLAELYDRHGDGPFEAWLRGHLATRRSDDGVVLSTVHRVKGQEWPHVVVHLADHDQYPHRLAENHEEERRLFHVAITRASQHATIVSSPKPSPFLDELTNEPPERTAATPRPRPTARPPAQPQPEVHPLADRSTVVAAVGLTLIDQGQEWEVVEIEPAAAVARRGETTRRFASGAKVETAGRQRGKLVARPAEIPDASVVVFDRLRAYRDRVRGGKPAYTVFDDKTLAAISASLPGNDDELLAVAGVGPAKLEQYGDDVLNLIGEITADTP